MELELAKWVWEQFGKELSKKARGKWREFNWPNAEKRYREKLKQLYSTTRLLGRPKPIYIDNIYTDIYIIDKLSAFSRFGIDNLEILRDASLAPDNSRKRINALRLLSKYDHLYILGKPGQGKLRY